MKTILLSGSLGAQFGSEFRLAVSSPGEALRALIYQLKGFESALRRGAYRITRLYPDRESEFDEKEVNITFGRAIGMRVEPVIAGAGSGKGVGKVVLGIALVGAALFFAPAVVGAAGPTLGMGTTAFTAAGLSVTYGQIALVGGLMALSGVTAILTPTPKVNSGKAVDENPSFLFDGIQNVATQGVCVPVGFGECWGGSVVVSFGIATEELPTT